MNKLGLMAYLKAKAGKENEVEEFLRSAHTLATHEPGTLSWYAVRIGPGQFGIFDTFRDEAGLQAHLNGEIAQALFANAEELFAAPPSIEKLEVLAWKAPASA